MTRQNKLRLLALEALLLLAIVAGLRHQVERETQAAVQRNRVVAEAIARHASDFFARVENEGGAFHLRDLNAHLDARLGQTKLFGDEGRWPGSFEVYRLQDLELGRIRPEILSAVDTSRPYTVQREGKNITVTVPFALKGQEHFYGIVRIPMPMMNVYANLFERNVAVYLTVFFLFGAQLILASLLLAKRRREILFEKGYLREHALGALKLQRQILDGIIQDHEGLTEPAKADEAESEVGEESGNVVHLSDLTRRRESL